jgi:Rhs element Vgr protein
MAVSPILDSHGDTCVAIYSGGQALDAGVDILSVVVTHAVNKVPSARIVMAEDDELSDRLPLSDSDIFKPGKEIRIAAGYGSKQTTIFEGVVVTHGLRSAGGGARLVVECRDKALAMTLGRRSANYVDTSDGDILPKLIQAYAGLSASVQGTEVTHKELVQFDVSDWDFMLARAEANGLVVVVEAGKVTVAPPATGGAAALLLTFGVDLLAFDADLDARSQLGVVDSVAWDPATQEVVTHAAKPRALNAQGNLDGAALAKVLDLASYRMQSAAPLGAQGLKTWSAARQMRAGLARVRGHMRFQGSALARPGTLAQLAGVGKRFEGATWLSAVTHTLADGDWITEAEFGMAPDSLAERHALAAPLAGGLTAGVAGLHIGVVKKLDEDPNKQFMIQVSLPVMQAETDGVWARLANVYGSDGVGSFFIPEIGDEVILGFLDNDPSHPLILGSLYSSKRAPPYQIGAENNTKAIVTRSKLKIEFDEEKKVVTVLTPGGNKVELNDDAKTITLLDETGNKLTLAPGGITLDSPKDIVLSAKGKLTIDAVGNVEITSKADLKGAAMNISSQASMGFTAKGASSAELSATGQTTVKGAMVMIN